jgi:Signal transduction histidine kinase
MRPWVKSWTAFVLSVVLLLLPCVEGVASSAPVNEYASYRDIPGVTEADIAAVEALKKEYTSFSYGMSSSTECFVQEDGRIGGFAALFAKRMTVLFEAEFSVTLLDTQALETQLKDGRIHFTGDGIAALEAGLKTDSIAQRAVKQVSLYNNASLAALALERPLRYVFLTHSTVADLTEPYITVPHEVIRVSDAAQAFYMLSHGEGDVFVDDASIEAALTPEYELLMGDFSPTLYNDVALLTYTEKLRPIITVVQKYLSADGSAEMRDMVLQGRQMYLQHKLLGQLTEAERSYLRVHQNPVAVIPMTIAYDNYPVSFYNAQENEWQGIAVDIIRKIEALTGMTFVCVNNRSDSWSSIIERLETDRVAMTLELIRTPDRESRFIWADPPYLTDFYALLSKTDYPDISFGQVKNARVGVIRGTAYAETFNEMFPYHEKTTYFETVDEAFDHIDSGSIDMIMATRNHLLFATSYMERVGYKENIVLDKAYVSSFGFNKNETILCSIVGKALRMIDTRQINDTWIRKVFDYRGKMARAQVPVLIVSSVLLFSALAVVVILLMKNRKAGRLLEKTVDTRTHQLLERTKELEKQTEMAQAAARAKSDFLARMSHEIRTPLNAIMGMTEIAKKTAAEEKTLESLNSVTSASSHLLGILNDVLDMSKIEAGKFILSEEPFDFLSAMNEVAEIIAQRCAEKGLTFIKEFEIPSRIGTLGDKLRLKQVLINLLGNAVKFTPSGGFVTMAVLAKEQAEGRIDIQFAVKDTGIGISDEQKERLFIAFEQAHHGIAQQYGGTGLGLTISQSLVRLLGGEITLESTLGQGSIFRFSISLLSAELEKREETTMDATSLEGRRILLAEDVEINRVILKELLAETKLVIEEAEDGLAAVNLFAASEPEYFDLIFMDIQMPNLNGYEAARQIRAMDRADAKKIPIIAMTANAYKEDVNRALEAGMNAHLPKPIDIVKVVEALSTYLV